MSIFVVYESKPMYIEIIDIKVIVILPPFTIYNFTLTRHVVVRIVKKVIVKVSKT